MHAQTVLGPIAADQMGITLPHEHLLIDFEVMFRAPASASDRGLAYQPVSMENLGWIRQNFSSNLDNLRLLCGYHHRMVHEGGRAPPQRRGA